MHQLTRLISSLVMTASILLLSQAVFAHVSIMPREAVAGQSQLYTMRVPTERGSATVRVEVEFPAAISVTSIDTVSNWSVETSKNAEGKITNAVFSGGSIAQGESQQFTFTADNPATERALIWKVVQIHLDGSRAEWVGQRGSTNPAPVVQITAE